MGLSKITVVGKVNSLPSQWSLVGLCGWPTTLDMKQGSGWSIGQQCGILGCDLFKVKEIVFFLEYEL